MPEVPLDMAFYGDVFLDSDGGQLTKGGPAGAWWEDLDASALTYLEEAAYEVLPEGAVELAEAQPPKVRTRMPGFLRAVDRTFPAGGVLAFGDLVQVRRYLTEPDVKKRVDEAVSTRVSAQCRVLMAHSLGSVVAFEYLRQHPGERLDLLVTLGSPLGLRLVRKLMPHAEYGVAFGVPPQLRQWVNVRDLRDPVACAGPLSQWWPGVSDCPPVNNGPDAHSAAAYLSKAATGQALLSALPTLAGPVA